ncbi:sigma-70 family RNA polymerase sigma factor [Clostridium botulinum]|uniref:Sigma-70 family RNA polymerase sigma factor n=1 Tax=Clostridium botulinum TaxID=1491 RepID=A0A6M0T2W1_CLOBO|nr:sigma-70 family RNA polymerase sigma factor [Clostridium botulinum]NFI74263.1 sigma-70 family RNA polymerase sigma factor [Clostridium sporogenes]NFP62171.1 sigma-70 family RNA polymerase sigma factor [Clostridium sporogenes]NFU95677.1 sigma-70 family RNA polymerase sigma factor [Clostridium sporogenes]NFV68673.1 sigma-70 family RNA polymerase sigma factor [Clostridium botulinum]
MNNDKSDIDTILNNFQELINIISKKYKAKYPFVELDELQQIGRIAILNSYENFNKDKGSLEGYIYVCVKNDMKKYILKAYRKAKIEKPIFDIVNIDTKNNELSDLEYTATIKQSLNKIHNQKDKDILEQLLLENKTQKNIAQNINCSQSTVSYRIKRCANLIKNDLRCFYG